MKLWHVQVNGNCGYDEYDSAVVAAETEGLAGELARKYENRHGTTVTLIGTAVAGTKAGEVCASFNAG